MYNCSKNTNICTNMVTVDSMIRRTFFKDAFEAKARIGIEVLTYFLNLQIKYISKKPSSMITTAPTVIWFLYLKIKDKYLTLAALTPSFKGPVQYKLISTKTPKANKATTSPNSNIQVIKVVHMQISIKNTKESPKPIKAQ